MTPRLEIEYCTQCRWLLRAALTAQELLITFEGCVAKID
jgi:selenoprotein W-related protein